MFFYKAPRFTPLSCRGFSADFYSFGLSGSEVSRKPLSHAFWNKNARQIPISLFLCKQLEFDFAGQLQDSEVRVLCNTRTYSNGLESSC